MGLTSARVKALYPRYLREEGRKANGILTSECFLQVFLDYVEATSPGKDFREIDREFLKGFLADLMTRTSGRTGRPYAPRTRQSIWGAVKKLFRLLYVHELTLKDPCRELPFNPKGPGKPKELMAASEVDAFLDGIDIDKPLGLRDRAMFELVYSSGLRAGEVSRLDAEDLDLEDRKIRVRMSKFGKDRIVPISETARRFLKLYAGGRKTGAVFKGHSGRLSPAAVNRRFKKLLADLGMYREGLSAHSLRRAAAAGLLSGGADLRYVQELLGHESLETTVGYTNELFENVKKIYKSYHPRENGQYREVDEAYLRKIARLKERLERCGRKREKRNG